MIVRKQKNGTPKSSSDCVFLLADKIETHFVEKLHFDN
jgi:hypothetical protein